MLRYEDGHPVGLDWEAIDARYAANAPAAPVRRPPAPKPRSEVRHPGTGKGGAQRTPVAVEREIVRLYVECELSGLEVGRQVGVRPATVHKVLRRRGVQVRSKSEAMKISRAKRDAR